MINFLLFYQDLIYVFTDLAVDISSYCKKLFLLTADIHKLNNSQTYPKIITLRYSFIIISIVLSNTKNHLLQYIHINNILITVYVRNAYKNKNYKIQFI